MDSSQQAQNQCPANVQECPLLEQIEQLKSEVARLEKQSQIDMLTGLFNLRFLFTSLEAEMERTRRTGLPTGLIMIDLDHFKTINDTYGHEAGNESLIWMSKIFRKNIRRIDLPCRYGGEEFAIILPGTRLSQAVHSAERLRRAMAGSPIKINRKLVKLTASLGVTAYQGRKNLSPNHFIKKADAFLLKAKAQGRNCVRYDENAVKSEIKGVSLEERDALFKSLKPKK